MAVPSSSRRVRLRLLLLADDWLREGMAGMVPYTTLTMYGCEKEVHIKKLQQEGSLGNNQQEIRYIHIDNQQDQNADLPGAQSSGC